jgi:hypothetical protein
MMSDDTYHKRPVTPHPNGAGIPAKALLQERPEPYAATIFCRPQCAVQGGLQRALGNAGRSAVDGAWRPSTAAAYSPVGTAINSPTPVPARMRVDARQCGLTGLGRSWGGSQAS